ncbi:uncharacterized protein LOC128955839 [Oppia nitens]|uniref:uncharacterized protein LOC128955839 n=1 Tax=Oppia nitens TaxID=1686743 RepID=UPI0023DA59B5|nr:uncharacterized protein LOC128955839 [Oppia nitens]
MSARELYGTWPTFWRGPVRGMAGLVRVDGKTYEFMGHPTQDNIGTNLQAKQVGLKVTPTQSIFTFNAGPIVLEVNFFTPIDPTDLKRLSLPASYIAATVRSTDKSKHDVQLYIDLSGEWTSSDVNEVVEWDVFKVNNVILNANLHLKNQKTFDEFNDMAKWGTIKFFTDSLITYKAGDSVSLRSKFVKDGILDDIVDKNYRRINDNWPGVAFARNMIASEQRSETVFYGVAHVRRPAINYTDSQLNQLWESYFSGDDNKMIDFVLGESQAALKRAVDLDSRIVADAHKVGGDSYVKVVSAALRQAFGGTELVGTPEKPWLMLKEISSDGNCQTVDVIYPHFPVQLYLNPLLLKYLLDPLIDNQEKGYFPYKYCIHDLGSSYPRCIGHRDGKQEDMEVEESANMLIMMSAYVRATDDKDWATKHYKIAKQWTQYLVDHGLITGDALTTDDFLQRIKNSTNLSIKAIAGIGAMAQLSEKVGNQADQKYYRQIAENYVTKWIDYAEDPSKKHLKFSYNTANTWFMVYNMYADILLDTKLVPEWVYKQQDEWYLSVPNKYGVPLSNVDAQTKLDWVMFTAASSSDSRLRQLMFDRTAQWLRETTGRVPFSDRIDSNSGQPIHFINRPVIGGVFAPLTVNRK